MRVDSQNFISGSYYHLFNHAAADGNLYKDDDDFARFISTLNLHLRKPDFSLIAYCLLPSHFHLLVRQDGDLQVFKSFYLVSASYARYFNKKYNTWGSIYRGKLQHQIIQDAKQLMQTCVYIHRNPLEAGIVDKLDDWLWSDYPEWVGSRNGAMFDPEVRAMFFSSAQGYLDFMLEYKPRRS